MEDFNKGLDADRQLQRTGRDQEGLQETFATENRSAIIARLMQEAVEDRKRQERRAAAIDALLELGERKGRALSDREISRARRAGRP